MNTKLAMVFAIFLVTVFYSAAESDSTNEDNTILKSVLKQVYSDGGYTVVAPETGFWHRGNSDSKEIKKTKKYITEHLQTNGIVVTKLVDQLFDRNKKPVRLKIESSPKDGYVVDFDGKYEKYFKKDGGGWEQWYKEKPKAHGFTTVSLPVFDQKKGLLLVYKGTQSHWLAGSGWVILYRREKGELKELSRVMLWIS